MNDIIEYFKARPQFGGLAIALIGVLLFVGALLKWEWVLSTRGTRRSFLRTIFGARGAMFINSAVIIIAGVVLFIFLKPNA